MRSWKYFATFWHGLYMGWTTRNHDKSGSNPSLKLAVEIQSSGENHATLYAEYAEYVQIRLFQPLHWPRFTGRSVEMNCFAQMLL